MSERWQVESTTTAVLGYYRIFFTAPGGARTDVTFFRDAPTQLSNYSHADPFGYAAASITFPQLGPMDSIGTGELSWLSHFADVDIVLVRPDGSQQVVWEGTVASYDWSASAESAGLTVQCKGALFQIDNYMAHPQYPSVPVPYEQLIAETLSPSRHPHLRTEELRIEWPENWDQRSFTGVDMTTGNVVTRGTSAGGFTTGFSTRITGGWEKGLTGFVAGLLSVMYTNQSADQWTIRCDPGRIPVMHVREAGRAPDYTLAAGQPGIESLSLSRDFTQFANVIYGSGSTPEGSEYSRQSVSPDNTRTGYVPFAADARVWPENTLNPAFDPEVVRVETHVKFDDGMYETDAMHVARLMLSRHGDPGYAGQLTLSVDPVEGSRYLMRAGEVLRLQYFNGTGERGLHLHIAEVTVNVAEGTVDLKVDSKFRDLLTIEEVLARTRDPLTPVKMLQLGKTSLLIPDKAAPWSYAQGSGYVPNTGRNWFDAVLRNEFFPFDNQARRYPPRIWPGAYVAVNAAASTRRGRWATVPIRLAEKGDIRLTQFAAYDREGNRLAIPFHVSLYYHQVTSDNMPYDDNGPSPFIPGAFQKVNEIGQPIEAGTPGAIAMGDDSLIIGWGDEDQPAGYSPGARSAGTPPTGLLVDETTWSFDNTGNPDFSKNPAAGFTQPESAITVYAMFYAEYHDWVFISGRLFRKEPGT